MPQYLPTQAHQQHPAGYAQPPANWQPQSQQQPDRRGQYPGPNRVSSPDQPPAQNQYYQSQQGSYQHQQHQQQQQQQQSYQQHQQQNYYSQQQHPPQPRSHGPEYGHNPNNSQDSYSSGSSGGDYRQQQPQFQAGADYYQPPQQGNYYQPQQKQSYRPISQQSAKSAQSARSAHQYGGRSSPQRSASPPKNSASRYHNTNNNSNHSHSGSGGNSYTNGGSGNYGFPSPPRARTFQGLATNMRGNYSNPDLSTGMQSLSLEGGVSDYHQQQPYPPPQQGQPLSAPRQVNPDARHGSVPNMSTYRDNYNDSGYYQQDQHGPSPLQQNNHSYPLQPPGPPSNAPSGVSSASAGTGGSVGAVSRAPYPLDDNVMGSFDLGHVAPSNWNNRDGNNGGQQQPQKHQEYQERNQLEQQQQYQQPPQQPSQQPAQQFQQPPQQSQQQPQQQSKQQMAAHADPRFGPPRRATTLPAPAAPASGLSGVNGNNVHPPQPNIIRNKSPPAVSTVVEPPVGPNNMVPLPPKDSYGKQNGTNGTSATAPFVAPAVASATAANGINNRGSSMTPPGERKQPPPPVRQYNNEPATNPAALAAAGDDESDTTPLTVEKPPVVAPVTVSELESLRHSAKLASADAMLQVKYAKRLAEAAVVLSGKYSDATTPANGSSVVDAKTERKNRDTWNAQALKILKKVSSQHVSNTNRAAITEALFFLASNYGSGGKLGLEPDYPKAYDLYVRAARLDHAESCYRAAVCSEIGAGTHRDNLRSYQWYKRAAQLDDVSAMYKLGMISLNGLMGRPRDFMDGFTWLKRAADRADHANPHAVHELGLLYERGQTPGSNNGNDSGANGSSSNKNGSNDGAPIALSAVIVKDEAHAFDLFVRAARLGYPPAQYRLGAAYEYGTLGRAVDPKRSISWYSHAAERGEPESELALSGWYLTGSNGVLHQSDTEAYLWARRAAEKGLAKAEYALGYFVEVGIGVKRDPEEAKRWYFKAAAQKHPKALARLQELRSNAKN